MATTAAVDRSALIDTFVTLDAFSSLITSFAQFLERDIPGLETEMLFIRGMEEGHDNGKLAERLWPDEEADESVECKLAELRAEALEARLLAILASDEGRSWLIETSAHINGSIERNLRGVSR